jgi:hypothetical protein
VDVEYFVARGRGWGLRGVSEYLTQGAEMQETSNYCYRGPRECGMMDPRQALMEETNLAMD